MDYQEQIAIYRQRIEENFKAESKLIEQLIKLRDDTQLYYNKIEEFEKKALKESNSASWFDKFKNKEKAKSYYEQINKLNEPERSQALSNYDEDFDVCTYFNSPENAIKDGFDWSLSQGKETYWIHLHQALRNNSYQFDKI